MYTIEEFDKGKTKILKYILYKKRSENEVRRKFEKELDENMLEDIIEYLKEAKYIDDTEYIRKTVNNFIILKNFSTESEYNINRFGKLLNNLGLNDHNIKIQRSVYSITINKNYIEDYIY